MSRYVVISREAHARLCKTNFGFTPAGVELQTIGGFPFRITDALPRNRIRKDLPVVQHDRFAEYGPDDMEWAEPLGLASWHTEQVHAEIVDTTLLDMLFPMHILD